MLDRGSWRASRLWEVVGNRGNEPGAERAARPDIGG